MKANNILPLTDLNLRDEYNRQLRAKRTKAHVARCSVIAAVLLIVLALAGMITTVCNPAFSAIVAIVLIAGFWGWRYLHTHH